MRRRLLVALCLVCLVGGCSTSGSQVQSGTDSGADATTADAESDVAIPGDALAEAEAGLPCSPVTGANPYPSNDCIYVGGCPAGCSMGTASGYACNASSVPLPEAGSYPSTFDTPAGIVTIVAYESTAYPWHAGAYVSCGPLSCVRWSTADHIEGGSTWPADPCGAADSGPVAWVCPPFPGVLPATDAGCINAGDMNVIGGPEAGVPSQTVWCCAGTPGNPMPSDAGADGAAEGGAGSPDASSE